MSSAAHRLRVDLHGSDHNPGRAPASVLLVGDDVHNAQSVARVLRMRGYIVTVVPHSGHALLHCLGGSRVDLLIAELSMADGPGPDLAERLRRYNPDLRALYLGLEGVTTEVENVLVRPFTRDDLVARVGQLIPPAR
jgi:CheY-like chemotaxis protein